jgi:DNA-binding transcriptional LysR family regulator
VHLSPRQLKVLVTLARTLSFSRTAELFHVTQPTLTKIVHDIEAEVGVPVFDRTTRSVRLTREGEELVPVAQRLVQDYEAGLGELEGVARRRNQRLAVAALPTLAAMLLPQAVAALRGEFPQAVLKVHDVLSGEAVSLLRSHQVDLALTATDAIHPDLVYDEICREPFVVLAQAGSPWTLPSQWSEAAFEHRPLITMPRGASTRSIVEAGFNRQGVPFRPVLEMRNLTSIARFVKAGCGLALLPLLGALLVRDEELDIVRLEGAPERAIALVTRTGFEHNTLTNRVTASIRHHAQALRASVR